MPVAFGQAPAGWRAGACPACEQPLALGELEHEPAGAGQRCYTCPRCGARVTFYSSAWLGDGAPVRS